MNSISKQDCLRRFLNYMPRPTEFSNGPDSHTVSSKAHRGNYANSPRLQSLGRVPSPTVCLLQGLTHFNPNRLTLQIRKLSLTETLKGPRAKPNRQQKNWTYLVLEVGFVHRMLQPAAVAIVSKHLSLIIWNMKR